MMMLELKQEVSRLPPRNRRELDAYIIRVRHHTPAWRKELGRRMRNMDAGKKIPRAKSQKKKSIFTLFHGTGGPLLQQKELHSLSFLDDQ
jgi:hypothetical protein